jgi:hypothetical protein
MNTTLFILSSIGIWFYTKTCTIQHNDINVNIDDTVDIYKRWFYYDFDKYLYFDTGVNHMFPIFHIVFHKFPTDNYSGNYPVYSYVVHVIQIGKEMTAPNVIIASAIHANTTQSV